MLKHLWVLRFTSLMLHSLAFNCLFIIFRGFTMKTLTLKKLSAAVMLLAGTQAAHALVPWTHGAPPAATTFYISGGAAQDLAFAQVVKDSLAAAGTLDVFGDATTASSTNFGARWQVYYFTGKASLGAPLAGAKIAVVKRSLGAAGYGVIPLTNDIPLEELDISSLTTALPIEPTTTAGTVAGVKNYRVVVTAANAATFLPLVKSHGGILGVDAKLLLKPGTKNYPVVVPRVGAGADVFPNNVTLIPGTITQIATGGLAYGIGVTTDLYKVLQAAQKRSGTLPAGTVIGDYKNEANIPTLSSNFIGSLIAGKVNVWDQVKIVNKATNTALALTSPTILADAGVALPTTVASGTYAGKVPVAVGNRNAGAAIGAIAYAQFLNFPWTPSSFAPAAQTANALEGAAAPIVKDPGGASATGSLLNDWSNGTNASTLNNVASATRWGIAVNDATRNTSGTVGVTPEAAGKQKWRYIRVDGYLPKIENIASGNYPLWGEGVLLYKTATVSATAKTVLTAIAKGLGNPTTANLVNNTLVTTWGKTGIFATANGTGFSPSIPFNPAKPVVAYTHKNGGVVYNSFAPVISNAPSGVLLK